MIQFNANCVHAAAAVAVNKEVAVSGTSETIVSLRSLTRY